MKIFCFLKALLPAQNIFKNKQIPPCVSCRSKRDCRTCVPSLFLKRSGRDSNPRGVAPKRFSRPPRYDHFDTAAEYYEIVSMIFAAGCTDRIYIPGAKKRETGFEPATPTLARLYSTPEPLAHRAGDGNRTHISSLEGWCSTTELHLRNKRKYTPITICVSTSFLRLQLSRGTIIMQTEGDE